jgi:hypothetical protein
MSQKFGIYSKGTCILTLLVSLIGIAACDPCRQLAVKICNCKDRDDEKKRCINDLGLAKDHIYIKEAEKDQKVCLDALNDRCTCEDINNGNDENCGRFRPASR